MNSLAVVFLLALPVDGTGQDLDSRIAQSATDAVLSGFQRYNLGDRAGTADVYERALTSLVPMLGHRPELKSQVEKTLADNARQPDPVARAFAYRGALNAIATETAPRKTPPVTVATRRSVSATPYPSARPDSPEPKPNPKKTLWERLGKEPTVRGIVRDWVTRSTQNPKVDFTRGGQHELDFAATEKLERSLIALISSKAGGPKKYEGRPMAEAHRGMRITPGQFDAMIDDLKAVMREYDVPPAEADELLAIVAAARNDIVEAP